jgi:hypothetical protein
VKLGALLPSVLKTLASIPSIEKKRRRKGRRRRRRRRRKEVTHLVTMSPSLRMVIIKKII